METELVLVGDVDEKMRQGWKLHGPPVLDEHNEWRQTVIQRYPGAYTSALMISTKKMTNMSDIEWLLRKIADYFARTLDYLLNGGWCENKEVESLMSLVGWPSFIPKFGMDNLCVLSVMFVCIFVVNPIMRAIKFGAALGQAANVRMTMNCKFILLAFKVFLKLSYLHLRDLEGVQLSQVDPNGVQFTGIQFQYADMILVRVQSMAKINGIFVNGDIPSEVRDRVRLLFESVLGDNREDLTHALWILLQY